MKEEKYSSIPPEIVMQTRKQYDKNGLAKFLNTEYGDQVTKSLIKRFGISSARNGALLWYEDSDNKFRTGKILSVDSRTGVVVSEESELIHETFSKRYELGFNYSGCCFGENQMLEAGYRPKGFVTDELLAIVLSALINEVFWFAPPLNSEFDIREFVTKFPEGPFFIFPNDELLPEWTEAMNGIDRNFAWLYDNLVTLYPEVDSLGLQKNSAHMQNLVARIRSVMNLSN